MAKRWRILTHDSQRISQLERAAGVSPVVAQLLLCRGIFEPSAARDFLDAKLTGLRDPELLPGLNETADGLHRAIADGRPITVYGDYDADGMTATAILYRCLRMLGAEVSYYVPNRLSEGYGLNEDALHKLADRGTQVVVTVDCGASSVAQAELARRLGLELYITDHHEFGPSLPAAQGLIHPRLPGGDYPFGGLCGAGVALKLAWALCQRASGAKKVGERMRRFLLSAVGLAAIGTIADIVPLLDENRVIVRHGLHSLKHQPPLGLERLMQVTELDTKPSLKAEDIAFTIGPRLNAAGRLGQAQLAVELLTTESEERAQALAEYLHELNSSRDSLERSIYRAAREQIKERFNPAEDAALVLAGRGWHAGVIGIVASRLVDKHHRPVVMISLDQLGAKPGVGSARTISGLNLHQALAACSEHLVGFGGHAAAAGLQIEESQVDAFRDAFCEQVAAEVSQEDRVAEVRIDAEAPLSQLTLKTVEQIETLAPFGNSNPRPILCCSDIRLRDAPRRMGGGDRHLSVKLTQGNATLRAVAFGQGDWADELSAVDGPVEIAYRPVLNTFKGRTSVELHLVDWRVPAS